MKYPFQKMHLEAEGFFDLIGTWAEMQLVVSGDAAVIIGDGYTFEIAKAFTALVLDWEARIPLPRHELDLPDGAYDLSHQGSIVFACKGQEAYPVVDRAVRVEVVSVPEGGG